MSSIDGITRRPMRSLPPLHDIFVTIGGKLHRGPGFRHLSDALRYVDDNRCEGPFLIRHPDGRWYRGDGSAVLKIQKPR